MASRPFENSGLHAGYTTVAGHLWDSLRGKSPDYISPESAQSSSGDTILEEQKSSIRDNAFSMLESVISTAESNGAIGKKYEREFNRAAQQVLPSPALRLPTLEHLMSDALSTPQQALATTENYLRSINLKVDPAKFMFQSFDDSARIINHYMDYTKDRPHGPVSGEQLLRQPRFRVLN